MPSPAEPTGGVTPANGCTNFFATMIFHGLTVPVLHGRLCLIREHRVTEIFVYLKDGSGLLSRLPGDYEEWPNGPFTLGNKGDITLYVTHRRSIQGGEWVKYDGVVHDSWGALATYIPAEQIARVDIRRVRAE